MLKLHQLALIEGIKKQPKLSEDEIQKLIINTRKEGLDFQNEEDQLFTPLHYAISYENISALKLLLNEKINLNAQDSNGNSPLLFAITKMNDEAALLLLRSGLNINMHLTNRNGDTALHLYARGDKRGIKLLSEYQSKFMTNIYAINNKGETPLHCAIAWDNMYFLSFFVNPLQNRYYGQSGALVLGDMQNPITGDNLVHTAVRRLTNKNIEDNEARVYIILHLLASIDPSLFGQANKEGVLKGSTPLDLFNKQGINNKKIGYILAHPFEIFSTTQCDKQLLGNLERNFNGISRDMQRDLKTVNAELVATKEELKNVKSELTDVKEQLSMLTLLLKQQMQLQQPPEESTKSKVSSTFFKSAFD